MKRLRVSMLLTFGALLCCPFVQAQTGAAPAETPITGPGKANYVPLWLGPFRQGNSTIFQNGAGLVGVGTATPGAALDVNGAINAATGFNLAGSAFAFGSLLNQNAFLGFSGNSTMTGTDNTATGLYALAANTSGYENTASGYEALGLNTTGYLNTAVGVGALHLNTTGSQNMAIGGEALQNNTEGNLNTATGVATLPANTTGSNNTATGWSALKQNTTGDDNTASGYGALAFNSSGGANTAFGMLALYYNVTGGQNTAVGWFAGPDINSPNLTNSTAIGYGAVVSQSNALVLGSPGVNVGIGTPTPSNVFTIAQGAGQAISDGWSVYSSRRWKTNVQTLEGALGKVEKLRGVSYDLRANGKHEVGVIAEEVGAVVPEVVTWNRNGKDAEGVDYSRLTALLIEATKEQQALIQEQQKQIQAQQAQIAQIASQVRTIRATLRNSDPAGVQARTVKAAAWTVHQ